MIRIKSGFKANFVQFDMTLNRFDLAKCVSFDKTLWRLVSFQLINKNSASIDRCLSVDCVIDLLLEFHILINRRKYHDLSNEANALVFSDFQLFNEQLPLK